MTEEIQSSYKTPEFKVGDRVRITKYKIIFSKDYNGNWSREVLVSSITFVKLYNQERNKTCYRR